MSKLWHIDKTGSYLHPLRDADICSKFGCRVVVVIDPEDPEQVKRFDDLLDRFLETDEVPAHEGTEGVLQAALREFANPTPTKPKEPTGLGAVVEDVEGKWWSRVGGTSTHRWHHGIEGVQEWRHIDAVRVLNPGVTA